ncbi:hypothetical protein ACTSKR_07825 [Chitinibacteraceae bacterium HSL-7]
MNDTTSNVDRRQLVSWRAAILIPPSAHPLFGKTLEVGLGSIIVFCDLPAQPAAKAHIYLELPDLASGTRSTVDFDAELLACTLSGNRFRQQWRIKHIKDAQRDALLQALGR